ncbi:MULTISPECIES: hypothetical protein [Sphingobacterium]|uniref:hypothetical protein n=1 Tax=Sphingobacterium TaxID=28453 RepID=UPI0016003672|nr:MULTISPECIES: hypothetical protein [Sphingobacterium]MBB1644842.1 hypothetical protein [Sphingobacterium sp. UME9]
MEILKLLSDSFDNLTINLRTFRSVFIYFNGFISFNFEPALKGSVYPFKAGVQGGLLKAKVGGSILEGSLSAKKEKTTATCKKLHSYLFRELFSNY